MQKVHSRDPTRCLRGTSAGPTGPAARIPDKTPAPDRLDLVVEDLQSDKSGLQCESCRRVYPIRDDIPVMLAEEAQIAPE